MSEEPNKESQGPQKTYRHNGNDIVIAFTEAVRCMIHRCRLPPPNRLEAAAIFSEVDFYRYYDADDLVSLAVEWHVGLNHDDHRKIEVVMTNRMDPTTIQTGTDHPYGAVLAFMLASLVTRSNNGHEARRLTVVSDGQVYNLVSLNAGLELRGAY